MRRRVFLAGLVAAPVIRAVRPDALPLKRAVFEEVGNSVFLSLALPVLVRRTDREAMASIDSGFDTTLAFELRLWQLGERDVVNQRAHTVKIRRDPWTSKYLVQERTSTGWARREFERREAALEAATTLSRVRLVDADQVGRGKKGPYYFVEVLAMRNPIAGDVGASLSRAKGRVGGRDLEWFGRLVDVLAGEQPPAEQVVHVRTNAFYLLPR